jgi:uncharacterized protein YkwD
MARKLNTFRVARALCALLLGTAAALSSLAGTTPQESTQTHSGQSQALGNTGAPTRSQYFAATGKAVKGDFLGMFERYGLERVGFPISDERTENGRVVQYFERVRMEQHPELAGKGYPVLMSRLGVDITGAPFNRVSPFKSTATRLYIPETGHSLSSPFLAYWRTGGSVELFGYPISEPLQQDGLLVQWFERARMEYHPELAKSGKSIQLTHLGKLALERAGGPPPQAQTQPQAQSQPQAARPAEVSLSEQESYLLKAINDQRASSGLRAVQLDAGVTGLGRARSGDMAQRNYFSHTSPDGAKFLDMLRNEGISFKYAGEILARNNYPTADAGPTALQSYLKSAPHKAVMLDGRYNYVGLGYAFSSEDQMHYFTVIFIER